MTEYRKGDRVKVEYEGIVTRNVDTGAIPTWSSFEVQRAEGGPNSMSLVYPNEMTVTKIKPALPTKLGTVIASRGFRFMLTVAGWQAAEDRDKVWTRSEFADSMYARDFTVLLEGKG